ncbi:hypothetical protein QTP86_024073, partial [Hemibagrus guttatus]
HGGLVVSTFASHLQRWGFDSRLRHVCVEFACSPRASGVSSPSPKTRMQYVPLPSSQCSEFQFDHSLYPWSESRRLVVLTDAVDGSVWTACEQETAVDRATWGL